MAFNCLSLPNPKSHFHLHSLFSFPVTKKFNSHSGHNDLRILGFPQASISYQGESQGTFDTELRCVLQLATSSELHEVERILFGPRIKHIRYGCRKFKEKIEAGIIGCFVCCIYGCYSRYSYQNNRSFVFYLFSKLDIYFSPLLKSIAKTSEIDYVMIEEDPEERDDFIEILESRFFFLAADARSTLRGWRPTYRNVLLGVRKELKISCSTKLSTEDLEVEIFLHLLQEYSGVESGTIPTTWKTSKTSSNHQGGLEVGLNQWRVQAFAGLKLAAAELRTMILKGGGMLTLGKLYQLLTRRLSGMMFLEAANYQITSEVIKKGGHLAGINLESRAALLAARQGVAGAASRYLGIRSIMLLLGPMLWGTFLADMVIQSLGTDYARILRAIYAFAQIRLSRTYKLPTDVS